MKCKVKFLALFFSLLVAASTFAKDSEKCEPLPLSVEITAFFENLNANLSLRSFEVEIENRTTGAIMNGVTSQNGYVQFNDYQPKLDEIYVLNIYKGWKEKKEVLCSSVLNTEYLVNRHREFTKIPNSISSLYFNIDGRHLSENIGECRFVQSPNGIYTLKL